MGVVGKVVGGGIRVVREVGEVVGEGSSGDATLK